MCGEAADEDETSADDTQRGEMIRRRTFWQRSSKLGEKLPLSSNQNAVMDADQAARFIRSRLHRPPPEFP